jgi:hypothetical protein
MNTDEKTDRHCENNGIYFATFLFVIASESGWYFTSVNVLGPCFVFILIIWGGGEMLELRTSKRRHLHFLVLLDSSGSKVRLRIYPLYSVCWYQIQVSRTVLSVKFIATALCCIIYYPSSENISLHIIIRRFRATNCSASICVILHLVISFECAHVNDAVSCSGALY